METQTRQGVGGVRSVRGLVEVAALVVHAAALELAEQVEEAVLIRGVTTQLLEANTKTHKNDYCVAFCQKHRFFLTHGTKEPVGVRAFVL